MNNNKQMMGVLMILGAAYFYMQSKKMPMQAQYQQPRNVPLGTGSMPASVGTGTNQMLGGIVGNLLTRAMGGGTSTGAPVPYATPSYTGDYAYQNNAAAADPYESYNPTFTDYEYF